MRGTSNSEHSTHMSSNFQCKYPAWFLNSWVWPSSLCSRIWVPWACQPKAAVIPIWMGGSHRKTLIFRFHCFAISSWKSIAFGRAGGIDTIGTGSVILWWANFHPTLLNIWIWFEEFKFAYKGVSRSKDCWNQRGVPSPSAELGFMTRPIPKHLVYHYSRFRTIPLGIWFNDQIMMECWIIARSKVP